MQYPAPSIISIILFVGTAAGTNAWSCGPSYAVRVGRYGVCGPPSQDIDTSSYILPELTFRRTKQRFYRSPWIEENRSPNQNNNGNDAPIPPSPWSRRSNTAPRYDISETKEAIQISMDVPGVELSNLSITLDETAQKLIITGRREQAASVPTEWTQKFVLKNPLIQANAITAQLQNGVLTVTLPKEDIPPKNVRTIPIAETTENPEVALASNLGSEPFVDATESVERIADDTPPVLPDEADSIADTGNGESE